MIKKAIYSNLTMRGIFLTFKSNAFVIFFSFLIGLQIDTFPNKNVVKILKKKNQLLLFYYFLPTLKVLNGSLNISTFFFNRIGGVWPKIVQTYIFAKMWCRALPCQFMLKSIKCWTSQFSNHMYPDQSLWIILYLYPGLPHNDFKGTVRFTILDFTYSIYDNTCMNTPN